MINYCAQQKAKIIMASHFGHPKGEKKLKNIPSHRSQKYYQSCSSNLFYFA
jgi:3-phosphoglycerate kinase